MQRELALQKSHALSEVSDGLLFRAGCVSDGSFLRRRIQLFIAYLYKPEVQAKVLQIPVYYSHIIPSLALQACKTRDTVKSRFTHPPLIADKGARALRQAQGPENLCGTPAFALKGQKGLASTK